MVHLDISNQILVIELPSYISTNRFQSIHFPYILSKELSHALIWTHRLFQLKHRNMLANVINVQSALSYTVESLGVSHSGKCSQ